MDKAISMYAIDDLSGHMYLSMIRLLIVPYESDVRLETFQRLRELERQLGSYKYKI